MFNDEPLTEPEIKFLWAKAKSDAGGDLPKAYFLTSQYVGEARLEKIGRLDMYEKCKTLPDYQMALESVKRGCRRLCELEFGIKVQEQGNEYTMNRMLCIESVRRAQNDEERGARIQVHALTFMAALLHRDLNFFRKLGTAMTALPAKDLNEHQLAHTLLNYWLTGFLWLMDTKTLAAAVAHIHKIEEAPNFVQTIKRLKAKDRWNLYSTKPALVCHLTDHAELEFTARGKRLLRPK